MTVNYEFFDRVDPDTAVHVVDELRAGQRPRPTRGARLCTLKEMSLQLAGYAEPREEAMADGPAGEPTLRGVRLAQDAGVSVSGFDPDTPIKSSHGNGAPAAQAAGVAANKPARDRSPSGQPPKQQEQALKEAK
jgi:NADH-quinone oxidoreductase subunit E